MIRPGALLKLNFPFNRWTKSKAPKYFLFSFTKSFLDALASLELDMPPTGSPIFCEIFLIKSTNFIQTQTLNIQTKRQKDKKTKRQKEKKTKRQKEKKDRQLRMIIDG